MNTALEHNTALRRIQLRRRQRPVQLHTVVKAKDTSAPGQQGRLQRPRHELHQLVLDQCQSSTTGLSVGEIAASCADGDAGPPPAAVCVAVSDLLHEGTLIALNPQYEPPHNQPLPQNWVLERVRTHLEQEQPVETAKIVFLGRPEETQAFLSHLDLEKWFYVSTDVESSVSRLGHNLYLCLVAVHHHEALEQLWPDLMRDADAAVLLARSDRLAEARASATLLTSRDLPFHTVVHLADERDLGADQVIDELGMSAAAPVVMVDIHSPMAPIVVLRDLCTQTGLQDGAHT